MIKGFDAAVADMEVGEEMCIRDRYRPLSGCGCQGDGGRQQGRKCCDDPR